MARASNSVTLILTDQPGSTSAFCYLCDLRSTPSPLMREPSASRVQRLELPEYVSYRAQLLTNPYGLI